MFQRESYREIQDLLSAFAEVEEPSASLVMSLSPGAHEAVQRLAGQVRLFERVSFSEAPADILPFFQTFDLFVHPCYSDSVPVAVLEAMAAGLPVISSATKRLKTIRERGAPIYLVPPGDVNQLAATIRRLLSDREKLRSIGRESQAYARRMHGGSLFAGRANYGYDKYPSPSGYRQAVKNAIFSLTPKKLVLWSKQSSRSEFSLTFDDGPDPVFTGRSLDVLRANDVRATFFLIGNRSEEHPDIVRRIVAEGHEIANHSYTHPRLRACSTRTAIDEVKHTQEILEGISGQPCRFFRPPFGYVSRQCMLAAVATGHQVIMWTIDLKDYSAKSPSEILSVGSLMSVKNGDVILYHGTNEAAIAALPNVIQAAKSAGRKGVTISELLRH